MISIQPKIPGKRNGWRECWNTLPEIKEIDKEEAD
jgi:hypothetical protein